MERGTQIHQLLEHLPMAAPADWHDLGHATSGKMIDATLVEEVMALIDKPRSALGSVGCRHA